MGVRASNFVSRELKLPVEKRYLWTDSECVLHWIRTTKLLPVFVENRIKEIKRETDITFAMYHLKKIQPIMPLGVLLCQRWLIMIYGGMVQSG